MSENYYPAEETVVEEKSPRSLSDAELKHAIDCRKKGRPLPSGINFNAFRKPHFLTNEEEDFIRAGNPMPEKTKARIAKEAGKV